MVDGQDLESWRRAHRLHGRKFVDLVNDRHPLKDKVYRTLRLPGPEHMGDDHFGFRIYLADCQRMYMRYLQDKLIRAVVFLHQEDTISEPNAVCLESTLKKYIEAVKDHQYMVEFSKNRDDPFIASSERLHDNSLFRDAISNPDLNIFGGKASAKASGPWEKKRQNVGANSIASPRPQTMKRAFWSRLLGAGIGGAFLIAPMWLLALRRDLKFHLSVTTVCVSGFGVLMAWVLDRLEAVFAATLAYAAVLMVFVGVMIQETV